MRKTNKNTQNDMLQKAKERMNLSRMLNESEEQLNNIQNSPVLDFLKATDKPEIVDDNHLTSPGIENRMSKIEEKMDLLPVSNQLFQVEALLKSLHLNQKNAESEIERKINIGQKESQTKLDQMTSEIEKLKSQSENHRKALSQENKKLLGALSLVALLVLGTTLFKSTPQTEESKKVVHVQEKAKKAVAPINVKTLPVIAKKVSLITTKFTNLRDKASSKGNKLLVVPPNSKFEILEEKYGWYKIKFHNYLKKKETIGWIYKENTLLRK